MACEGYVEDAAMYQMSVYSQDSCCCQVEKTGDVIAFYNHVFVPVVKTDLLKISQDRKTLSAPPQAEGLHGASPVRNFNRYTLLLSSASTLSHRLYVHLVCSMLLK